MPIQTSCPHCRTNYRLPDSQLGKRVRCKSCSDTFVVEGEEEVPVLEEATADEVGAAGLPPPAEIVEELPVFEGIRPPPAARGAVPPLPRGRRADEEEDEEEAAPRSGGGNLLLILGGAAALLLLLGVGGGLVVYFAFSSSSPGGDPVATAPAEPAPTPADDRGKGGGPNVPIDDPGKRPPVGVPQVPDRRAEPKDVADAVDRLRDPDRQVRTVALLYLERNPVDEARRADVVRAVRPIVTQRDQPGLREPAARVLARYAGRGDVSDLVSLLDESDAGVWRAAMAALGGIDDERAVEALEKQLTRPGRLFDAATALSKAGRRAEKFVVKHLHSDNPGVRSTAQRLLAEYRTEADVLLEQTVTDLGSSPAATKRSAAEWLVRRKPDGEAPDRVSKALEPLLTDTDLATRHSAARAMEHWATADSVPGLVAALNGNFVPPGTAVKDSVLAASLLPALGRLKDDRGLGVVVAHLGTGERAAATRALVAYGSKAEPPMLVLAQKSVNADIRRTALTILAEVGTKKSLSTLPNYARWHPRDRANVQLVTDVLAKIKAREK